MMMMTLLFWRRELPTPYCCPWTTPLSSIILSQQQQQRSSSAPTMLDSVHPEWDCRVPKESTDETTTIVFFGHRRTTTIIIILKQNQICALERRWNWQNAVESSLDFSKESNELYWPTVQGFRTWNSWETLNVLTGRDNRTGTAWNTVNPSHIDHM